jgi:hypothetical protein
LSVLVTEKFVNIDLHPDARLVVYGQELNRESYVICTPANRKGKIQLIDY